MTYSVAKNTSLLTMASVGQRIISFVYFTIIARIIGVDNTGQYFFNVTPINASKNGLYMDQSGNAFKCPNASSVTTRTGCEKM